MCSDAKRDSMCSVVSVNTALSLELGATPEDLLNDLDFDDVSTLAASTESSPAKDKLAMLDMDVDGNMPSRKRRAEHFEVPNFQADDAAFRALGGASEDALFVPDDVTEANFDNNLFMDDFRPELADDDEQAMQVVVERSRSQSAERRRIQSELLARLERLDGIELEEPSEQVPSTEIKLENDGQPATEQPEPKLGIYNEKQRIERLNAYREKRKQRVYGRVRYVLRQKVSEARPRVKGRFVKQTPGDNNTASSPDSTTTRDQESSTSAAESPASSLDSPVRRVEFNLEAEESPLAKRGRTAWEMFKNLNLFSPIRSAANAAAKQKRPSLPASFSEKLLMHRRKSTTAASTASGRARRKFSRDEFFEEEDVQMAMEPERKRATSQRIWT